MSATVTRWDDLHVQEKHRLSYPSEHVVRFVAGLEPGRALDIGCGAGRHAKLMIQHGFKVDGVDASPVTPVVPVQIVRANMAALPFHDETFDVALAFGVFYYGTHTDHLQAIFELHRVLKPGGQALIVTRTFRDSRANAGERVDIYTRRMTEGDEEGMMINFLTNLEVERDYGVFRELSFELSETTRDNRRWRDSDWLITVSK